MIQSLVKNEIRSSIIKERRKKYVSFIEASYEAAKLIINNIKFSVKDTVGIYWPITYEIDTRPLIKMLLQKKIKIALPYISNSNLFFKAWKPKDQLEYSVYKFYMPYKSRKSVNPKILVLPCLAIDSRGNRIGYGKGFYDKYYRTNKGSVYIGYAYSFQYFKSLPSEKHDLKLNYLCTEKFLSEV